jgi:redox-sensitive bicupin YhaK (pirin superfamily)
MSWHPCNEPVCEAEPETVNIVIDAKPRDLGGFTVRRVLPSGRRQMVGPFIFFDHVGPAQFKPGTGIDVRPHPHIGISTLTYLFEGQIMHRDSLGCVQRIEAGAVNWMTTTPEERAKGPRLHGIQSWLALPLEHEETEPSFNHYPVNSLPVIESDGAVLVLIAGEAYGARAPTATFSPMFYVDAKLIASSEILLPNDYVDRAVYVVDGEVSVGGKRVQSGKMAIVDETREVTVRAHSASRTLLLGGAPLEGQRHIWWNFVSSSEQRIEQAKKDWENGGFGTVPGDHERMPLPKD